MTISATGNTILNALAAARRVAGLRRVESPIVTISGENGLYRVKLLTGTIVEITIQRRSKCSAFIQEAS